MGKEHDEDKLNLVVGENIPENAPSEFHTISLFIKDKNGNLNLYADISLPYLINYSEFINISEDDLMYIFREGYDSQTESCEYTCMVKPFGDMKGVYRIFNGRLIKIRSIKPLCEIDIKDKPYALIKK